MNEGFYTKKAQEFLKHLIENDGFKALPKAEDFKRFKAERVQMLGFPVPREVIESGDVEVAVNFFETIQVTKGYFRNKVLFSISGYDRDKRELYEIKEVVDWIRNLISRVPYIFYYIDQSSWAFIQCCIAEQVTSFSKYGERIDVEELNRRLFEGGDIPQYQNHLETSGVVVNSIISSIKRLGAKNNDLKGAMAVIGAMGETYQI